MKCNCRARARDPHGHGEVLLTLLKFSQVRGVRTLLPPALADPLPACARLYPGPTDERSESV